MISLNKFIDSVHDAVVSANDTLTDSSVGILARFFNKSKDEDGKEILVPEEISIKYPHISDSGVEYIDVNVPLLTLAPLTCPTIDSVEFSTKFLLAVAEDQLKMEFLKDSNNNSESQSNRVGNLKIVISPQDVPEGLKSLVEGYERALKLQIP